MDIGFPTYPLLDGHPRARATQATLAAEATMALNGNAVFPLDHIAGLRIDGADTDAFLQGQVSSDVSKLTPDRSQLAAYSSPKGRVLAVLCLSRGSHPTEILAETQRDVAERVLKRLSMFVLRAKVKLEPSDLCAIGLSGPDSEAIAEKAGLSIPAVVDGVVWTDALQVIRKPGRHPRFSIRGTADHIGELWRALARHASVAGSSAWRLLDILAGLPIVYPSTQERFVPQMINLDLLGGISFDKGCYTGQEIVARLHYLGNLKRRMFLLHAHADASDIPPGAAVTDGEGGETVGEIVDAAPSGLHQSAISAVLTLSHTESECLRLGTSGLRLGRPAAFAPRVPVP